MNRRVATKAQAQKLLEKVAKNRIKGQRKTSETEAQILREYSDDAGATYRSVAARHGVCASTVMRIVRRALQAAGVAAVVLFLSVNGWS
jgi:hypothetical protein